MGSNFNEYIQVLEQLQSNTNVSKDLITSLRSYVMLVYQSDQQNKYSEPMPWIGMYIALASLICILAMVADLLHGFLNRKLWFPCKYFTMNAASLTMIAIAMKLPMDLNNPMPSEVDQLAKTGSMAFMCTMMANLLPSLANMDSKELLTNIIAFSVLVITLVVNVCIQINTGVFSYVREFYWNVNGPLGYWMIDMSIPAVVFIPMLLMLLIIHICSSLAILNSKQMIESKYQAGHEAALKDLELQLPGRLSCEKLKQHVSNYWIMAGTGNPQFMAVCFTTTSASGAICVVTTFIQAFLMYSDIRFRSIGDYQSDYKWSMLVILIIQFIGVILGTIAPVFRFFATFSFKLSIKWIWNHIKVFKVESYWTNKLSDWKKSRIPFSFGSRKCKIVIQNMKIIVVILCIGLQKIIVVVCKIIGLVPNFLVICLRYCWKWLKAILSALGTMLAGKSTDQLERHIELERHKDLSCYVLLLQDDMDLANRTLKGLSKSVNHLIQKAEKRQPNNLLNLLKESSGFEGVRKYDSHHVPPLPAKEYLDCWSLALVTLTTIAISLPNIQNNIVDRLLSSVSEGLAYVTLVEETLNATRDYANIQKAAKILWLEVEVYHKWLGNKLQKVAPQENTAGHILQRLKHTSINLVLEVESTCIGSPNDDSIHRSVCANSMYRITESILLYYHTNIEQVSQEELFAELSSMVSDILAACLINLPQVIAMKCYTSAIEKREANIHVAARLLGETTQIMNTLQDRELPILNPHELAFIDKWRTYLQHPFP